MSNNSLLFAMLFAYFIKMGIERGIEKKNPGKYILGETLNFKIK